MTLDFVQENFHIGQASPDLSPQFIFYKKGFRIGSGKVSPDWREVTLSGVGTLSLVNAKKDGLTALKLFGATEQRNLPSEYTQVEYLESTNTQYIDTGIVLNSKATITTVGQFLVWSSSNPVTMWGFLGSNNLPRWSCSIYRSNWLLDLNATSAGMPSADMNIHTFVQNCTDTSYDGLIDGVSIYPTQKSIDNINTYTSNTLSVYLFARNNDGTVGNFSSARVYSFNIVQNDELVLNLIPCKRKSDDELGMYDTVSKTFLTNSGTGTFIAGADVTTPSPNNPMDIVCNNGVLKLSPNLFDKNTILENVRFSNTTGNEYNSTGDVALNVGRYISDLVPVQVGNTYTKNTTADAYHRIKTYDSNKICLRYIDNTNTITIQENEAYIAISGYLTEIDGVQLEQGSTATPYIPYGEIYADGKQETVTVTGENLFDKTTIASNYRLTNILNKRYGSSTDFIATTDCFVSVLIPVEVGKTYFKNSPEEDAYHRYKVYDENQICIRLVDGNTITIQEGEAYIAFCGYLTELDSTILSDNVINVQTATAEMLLSVGNYKDVQEMLSGGVTRNVGIKVFDGTESFALYSNTATSDNGHLFYSDDAITDNLQGSDILPNVIISSHFSPTLAGVLREWSVGLIRFQGGLEAGTRSNRIYMSSNASNVTQLKQYLADQYNAGTPVIVVYPLAEPTTETVTAQPLTIQAGTNIITAEGSIDNLGLEVSYKAGVSVTITEVQNAQLDNNVEVIING